MNGAQSHSAGNMTPLMGMQNQSDQSLLDMMQKYGPQKEFINLNDMNRDANEFGLLNEYQSRAAERELDPKIARLRDIQQNDVLSSYDAATKGELPLEVQNALTKAGLGAALSSGGGVARGTVGNKSAERVFGSGYLDYLNQMRNLSNGLIQSTPRPVVGLDPGSALSIRLQNQKDNQNLENQFRQQLVGNTAQAHSNLNNLGLQLAQAGAAESGANAQSGAAGKAQTMGMIASIGGAAIMAA